MSQRIHYQFASTGLLVAFIFALAVGCFASFGRLQLDDNITRAFKNYEMQDGYQYYYSGRENKPSAIIGIDPAFAFSSKMWTAIEPGQFQRMVDRMYPPDYGILYGANMMSPDGKVAGVWYSWVDYFSAKFDGNRVIVYSPEPYSEADGSGTFRLP